MAAGGDPHDRANAAKINVLTTKLRGIQRFSERASLYDTPGGAAGLANRAEQPDSPPALGAGFEPAALRSSPEGGNQGQRDAAAPMFSGLSRSPKAT